MTISVVIPAYNAAGHIGRAIDSVLGQTVRADEIIVVDDGSDDNTVEVVQEYGDSVKLICQQNAGASVARNTGIMAAGGDWIAFLDADDRYLPDKLSLQAEHLARNPDLVWTTGNFMRCRCSQNHTQLPDISAEKLKVIETGLAGREYFDSYFDACLAGAAGCTDTMLIKKQTVIDAGLFCQAQPRINDVDMWLRIAYGKGKIGFVSRPLAVYHTEITDSIVRTYTDSRIMSDFLDRHLALAGQANYLDQFRQCAESMLGYWIYCRLQEGQSEQVRRILKRHGGLLSPYCRITTYIRTIFPRTSLFYERLKGNRCSG